uniref:Beta-lactamase-related domain-containing protein n=1 Tax=Arcella intermedia TaxID=1963864 RepID=A0A6B2L5G7_9EUKA
MNNAIANKIFPGCVALVSNKDGILLNEGFGYFTYGLPPPYNNGINPPTLPTTRFDMASLTKVTTTTTAVAQFYQRGELSLHQKVGDILGEKFNVHGKQDISILNLLLHNSGFYADPDPFWNTPQFGCPQTAPYYPLEDFECSEKIYSSILDEKLLSPVGRDYLYSDLNFLTLAHVVGNLAERLQKVSVGELREDCSGLVEGGPGIAQLCYFEAYVRKYVIEDRQCSSSGFGYLDKAQWAYCAPAENDTDFLHSTYQGQVSDGNAFASGGIAGHAGFFSTTEDVLRLVSPLLFPQASSEAYMNETTVALFTKIYNRTQSSRALGWNTNDPNAPDRGWNQACGSLASETFMHLGYTGTMICADPVRKVLVVLLTNHVYPVVQNAAGIHQARQDFATAVQKAYDNGNQIV